MRIVTFALAVALTCWLQSGNQAFATSCEGPTPPRLKDRIKDADVIFLGTPIHEENVSAYPAELNVKTIFKISKSFKVKLKGKVGILHTSSKEGDSPDGPMISVDCRPSLIPRFTRAIGSKLQFLIFAKKKDGKYSTSTEIGFGPTKLQQVAEEVELLTKGLTEK